MSKQSSSKQSSSKQSSASLSAQLSEPGLGKWAGIIFAGFSLFWAIVLVSHQSLFLAQQQQIQAVAAQAAEQEVRVDDWDSQGAFGADRSLNPRRK